MRHVGHQPFEVVDCGIWIGRQAGCLQDIVQDARQEVSRRRLIGNKLKVLIDRRWVLEAVRSQELMNLVGTQLRG